MSQGNGVWQTQFVLRIFTMLPQNQYDIHYTGKVLMLLKNLNQLHVSTNQSGCNPFHQMAIYECEILYRF